MAATLVTYDGALRCRAVHDASGSVVVTDAPIDNQGRGEGFSPSDLLAVSLGSCVLTMMGMAARSMECDIAGATATVTKDMADGPRRIARLSVRLRIPGTFDADQRRRLEAAAHACPVHAVLGIDAPVAIDWVD